MEPAEGALAVEDLLLDLLSVVLPDQVCRQPAEAELVAGIGAGPVAAGDDDRRNGRDQRGGGNRDDRRGGDATGQDGAGNQQRSSGNQRVRWIMN